jgi:hypothetical protein
VTARDFLTAYSPSRSSIQTFPLPGGDEEKTKVMKFIVILGPSAVGKVTVGRKLSHRIGYTLFHNHMVIELVHNFFTWSDQQFWNLVGDIRNRIFQEIQEFRNAWCHIYLCVG